MPISKRAKRIKKTAAYKKAKKLDPASVVRKKEFKRLKKKKK